MEDGQMAVVFTEEKKFTREDIEGLFLSVNWESGRFIHSINCLGW